MILVTGATGHLGTAVIQQLLKRADKSQFAALVRNPEKASFLKENGVEIRQGHFDDPASLDLAMKGISKVLLISGADENRLQQHKNVVDAAVRAGVKHMAYTGIAMKDFEQSAIRDFLGSHFQTEEYIKSTKLTYTFLRNTLYTEAILMFAGEKALETGIFLPTGDGKVSFALRREMGEAAANVLIENGHENKVYDITGAELSGMADVASMLSELSGRSVNYTQADPDTFPGVLRGFGVPEAGVMIVTGFSADIRRHHFELQSGDLAALLGRQPLSLKDSLKELFGLQHSVA